MDRVAAMTTFVKVVEVGSLSAAARSLDLSLPSVSRQLDGLEEHLRTRLLLRTTRRLALTEGGRTYYDQAKRIPATIEEAEFTLSAQDATPSGRLIVSIAVPVITPLTRLAIGLQAEAEPNQQAATSLWLTLKPRPLKASAKWRWLGLTHSSAASGSPPVAEVTRSCNAASRPGCFVVARLHPAPARRTRPGCSSCRVVSSTRPRPIVLRTTPVATGVAAMPPYPALAGRNQSRARSSRNGDGATNRDRMAATGITRRC